jgi:transposase
VDKLFVGVDVGSRDNAVHIMLPDGSKHKAFSVQNNLGGAQSISKQIVSALAETRLSSVSIAIEATGVYGDGLMFFLREDAATGQFERKLYALNPKQVSKLKQAYPDLPKNDGVDAFIIADSLRFGRITAAVYMDDYRYTVLRQLTRARFYAVQNLSRKKRRFKSGDS